MTSTKLTVEGWNSLSTEEKAQVEFIIKSSGVLSGNFTIEADPAKPEFAPTESFESPESWWTKQRGKICKIGCDTAASVAAAACTGISSGVGVAACIAAAEIARQVCRDECPG